MDRPETQDDNLVILMPVYNDWGALSLLLPILDRALKTAELKARVLLVDDGSTASEPKNFETLFESIETIDVLSLRRNLGHQRAIAVGLSYIAAKCPCNAVVVMDSDGEDDPRDVPSLIKESIAKESKRIVFAARTRRMENFTFKLFYQLYRAIHFLLTGVPVRVGNFSVIPWDVLNRLVAVSELWNHYAAAAHKARLPMAFIPTKRSQRLEGFSRMNFVALVVHGLSAMAVFGDRIGVRLLIIVSIGMALASGALIVVFAIRLLTTIAVPGWVTYVTGMLLLIMLQMMPVLAVFAFMILASRDTASFIPSRDYIHFISGIRRVHGLAR